VLCWERPAFYILARRIFLKVILSDGKPLKMRLSDYASEVETMYFIA